MILAIIDCAAAIFFLVFVIWNILDRWNIPDFIVNIGVTGLVVMVVIGGGFLIIRSDSKDFLAKFRATEQTVIESRQGDNMLENAALTTKIIEMNQDLAVYQRGARSNFAGWFYIAEIKALKPIR